MELCIHKNGKIPISCWALWKSMKICKLVKLWDEALSWMNPDQWLVLLVSNRTADVSGKYVEEVRCPAFILVKDMSFMTSHPLIGLHSVKCIYIFPGLEPFSANIVTDAVLRLCTFTLLKWVYQPELVRKKMCVKCLFWILNFSIWLKPHFLLLL